MFDPYDKWLRISDDQRPVTHYRLLGIDPEEDDPDAIMDAAKKQKSRIAAHQDGPHGKSADRLIKEINQAKATLLDRSKRRDYDRELLKVNGKNGSHAEEDDDDSDDTPSQGRKRRGSSPKSSQKGNPAWLWPVMGVAALLITGGIVAGVVLTDKKKPEDPPKKEVAEVKEKDPAPLPPPKKEEKPEPKPEKQPEVKQPEVKPQVPVVVTPPPQPQPAPAPPPPAAKFVKMKVPDSTAQAKATETIQAAYKADYAKTKPEDKLNLAAKFLQPGRENRKDPAEWFVMLREARDLAVQAGRPRLAVEAVREIDKWYIIDPHAMKIDALTAINDAVKEDAKESIKEFAARIIPPVAMSQVYAALDDDNYDAALKLISIAESATRKGKQGAKDPADDKPDDKADEKVKDKADAKPKDKAEDKVKDKADDKDKAMAEDKRGEKPEDTPKEKTRDENLARIEDRRKEVLALQKVYQQVVEAQIKLKQTPDDPSANLIVGKHLCYFHDKWEEGLPLLAKTTDPLVRPVAFKEMGKPDKFKDVLSLGDDWWELSKKEENRKEANLVAHALVWYDRAEQKAEGADKIKVADRIKEARKKGPTHLPRLLPGSFYGRINVEERTILLREGGGTKASEEAVAQGLDWLAQHQFQKKDRGLWSTSTFNQAGQCTCADPGEKHDIAGTALGLLPFLGAGTTHQTGKHKDAVNKGLLFLLSKQKKEGNFDDNYYENALATIAVSEACGLASDRVLRPRAQASVNYIVSVQNSDGSWGYGKGSAGDLSVTGWQFAALKAAYYAGLRVPKDTFVKVTKFLEKVEDPGGLGYGYNTPGAGRTTSATGWLCREYLGWGPDNPKLVKGINNLAQSGNFPTRENANIYFACYNTQVMHHFGDKPWENWNRATRDLLIDLQDKGQVPGLEHMKGSWSPSPGEWDKQGGRLMYTALALITLETYYYHVPLYGYGEALWRE